MGQALAGRNVPLRSQCPYHGPRGDTKGQGGTHGLSALGSWSLLLRALTAPTTSDSVVRFLTAPTLTFASPHTHTHTHHIPYTQTHAYTHTTLFPSHAEIIPNRRAGEICDLFPVAHEGMAEDELGETAVGLFEVVYVIVIQPSCSSYPSVQLFSCISILMGHLLCARHNPRF